MSTGLGERIKKRRQVLGLSQDALAKRLGLKNKSSVCKVEKGDDNLTTDKIRQYAAALQTTPSFLMGWEDDTQRVATGHDPGEVIIVGGEQKSLPVFSEGEDIDKAIELYRAYAKASPEVQSAVELILKSAQQGS